MDDGDPLAVYKGRHVFLGDGIKDEYFDAAVFQDIGASTPSMEATRSVDAYGVSNGFVQSTADAHSAYLQCFIGGGRGKGVPTFDSTASLAA